MGHVARPSIQAWARLTVIVAVAWVYVLDLDLVVIRSIEENLEKKTVTTTAGERRRGRHSARKELGEKTGACKLLPQLVDMVGADWCRTVSPDHAAPDRWWIKLVYSS